jgi:hypothetical protein
MNEFNGDLLELKARILKDFLKTKTLTHYLVAKSKPYFIHTSLFC